MKNAATIENQTSFADTAPALGAALEGQLELAFAGSPDCSSRRGRRQRLSRANWWFQRMRQIVERACDWEPAPEPRPEQTWLPGAYRQPALSPQVNPDQQLICE